MEDWLTTLCIISTVLLAMAIGTYYMLAQWAELAYDEYLNSPKTECDIDAFTPCKAKKVKVALAHKLRMGSRVANTTTSIPLECTKSEHVPGLYVSRRVVENATDDPIPVQELLKENKKTVVVATIRMGFGHHRLAYSACSWALQNKDTNVIFHDLLNIESDESALIQSVDKLYSMCSRWASELGGPVEKLWGLSMKQGDADALRIASLTAAHLMPLLKMYPKDTPLIATHQLVALVAAAAGFTNVVNLVVDNYPQWFLVVPKTLNITQGPVNYQSFLTMGVKPEDLALAGHWCPYELVDNIDVDCQRRMARAMDLSKPRRLLIPVGGAGAQKAFILQFLTAVTPLVKDGKLQLFLNAGDHKHMKTAFMDILAKNGLDYDLVTTTQGVLDFQKNLLVATNEPPKAVTLFAFEEYFPAVATTDILSRVADVLTCKPSELAFYPLPKLHIRRVGDHEADSARRAAEAGDGTMEAREIDDCLTFLNLMLTSQDLLVQMNQAVVANNKIKMYHGCSNAVTWAMEGTKSHK